MGIAADIVHILPSSWSSRSMKNFANQLLRLSCGQRCPCLQQQRQCAPTAGSLYPFSIHIHIYQSSHPPIHRGPFETSHDVLTLDSPQVMLNIVRACKSFKLTGQGDEFPVLLKPAITRPRSKHQEFLCGVDAVQFSRCLGIRSITGREIYVAGERDLAFL